MMTYSSQREELILMSFVAIILHSKLSHSSPKLEFGETKI